MAKFGLGKGLADLETLPGDSPEIVSLSNMPERVIVRQVPVQQIAPNPDQPRKTFLPDELDDLAQSIREHGVLQPIIIRAVIGKPHLYEIVAGERRWRASQIAGKDVIPALVKPLDQGSAMEIALIENIQRENLNAIEECEAYKNIMAKCGYAMSDLAKLIGKSESYIRNIMRLGALPDGVKRQVAAGEISASHARTIAVAENAEELARKIATEKLSVRAAEDLARAGPRSSGAKRSARKKTGLAPELVKQAEQAIEAALNIKAKLSVRASRAGTIVLSFENEVQMDMLVGILTKTATV